MKAKKIEDRRAKPQLTFQWIVIVEKALLWINFFRFKWLFLKIKKKYPMTYAKYLTYMWFLIL